MTTTSMRLVLGLVVMSNPDCCEVELLEGRAVTAGWSAPFASRAASVGPGCLVAVDVAAEPTVVWRWFPATVTAVHGDRAELDEPFHGAISAPNPGVRAGDVVFVGNGLADDWRIDATATDPGWAAKAWPEIEELYERMADYMDRCIIAS